MHQSYGYGYGYGILQASQVVDLASQVEPYVLKFGYESPRRYQTH
jgi:hypothetical protein